jgi:predicted transcriptional regulator
MPSSLFETVASFLNKEGGTILLGVLDDGSVTELVSSWLRIGTKLPDLRLSNINHLDNPTVFEVPSLQEKSTNLLGKRFFTLIKILIATAVSISMDKLMTFMNYKNRKTFKELYMQPLIQNGLIESTIREKPNDPNQKYIITRKGRLFLGGFEL